MEEYLLHNLSDDCFVVWSSKPSIVVGKHQNALAEINVPWVHEHAVPVFRRISGGGTVYHDEGNLNFTFITREEAGRLIDFKRYALPVIDFLAKLGIQAYMGDKNELLTDGLKISGNAMHVFRNRVLHHGTLLFNSNLNLLRKALSANGNLYQSRAVASNRASVTNIAGYLSASLTIDEFSGLLMEYAMKRFQGQSLSLSTEDDKRINALAAEKYTRWEWTYGYSPDYRFENFFTWNKKPAGVKFSVSRGMISEFRLQAADFSAVFCNSLPAALNGCRHDYGCLLEITEKIWPLTVEMTEQNAGDLLRFFF
jgi:lipoate-protein ligase A